MKLTSSETWGFVIHRCRLQMFLVRQIYRATKNMQIQISWPDEVMINGWMRQRKKNLR